MPQSERSGYLALLLSALLFSLSTMMVKLASSGYSGFTLSSLRFVIGIVLNGAVLLAFRGGIRVINWKDCVLRGVYGAFSMTLSYLAISLTSNGRATLLSNTYPVFVAVFAALFFHEKFSLLSIPSLALCTFGSAAIMNDGAGYSSLGDALALLSSVFAGISLNHLKRARKTDDPFILSLFPCLFGLPVSLSLGSRTLVWIPGSPLVFAVLAGLFAFAAQAVMTWGYKHVPVSRGSRVFYLETIAAVGLGALLGERLKPIFFLGGALILAGLALDAWTSLRKYEAPGPLRP